MEEFTASNGLMLVPHRDGSVRWEAGFSPKVVTAALREFFLHERDQELGRWRERPSCTTVVYPNGADDLGNRCVIVLYEPTAGVTAVYENNIPGNLYGDAARNYFSAHPELKPWMDVAEGVYAVTPHAHPRERLIMFRDGAWLHLYKSPTEHQGELHTAEWIAKVAHKEGRLTRLVPEVSDE